MPPFDYYLLRCHYYFLFAISMPDASVAFIRHATFLFAARHWLGWLHRYYAIIIFFSSLLADAITTIMDAYAI